eukprot:symbB.v1.2.010616.t1/scaffold696.1/size260109/9
MESDSDDEYWGSYDSGRLPTPLASFTQGGDWIDSSLPSRKLSAGSIGSTPSTCSQETVELEPGALISVGGRSFELHSLLGVGSFGSVWRASCNDSGKTVALKEILTFSKESMEAAKLEAQRLHDLCELIQDTCRSPALPLLLAAATSTALEGGQLLIPTGHPIAQAFYFVSEMLRQLTAVMQPLSKRFLHRDANSQNILVQVSSGLYDFGLIDFGLAVDATSWATNGWHEMGAAGDGRFWTTSSWLFFTNGPEALTQDLQSEYRTSLDLHSIGLSALQALVILSCEAGDVGIAQDPSGAKEWHQAMDSLKELQKAWTEYWSFASTCWEQVIDAFNRDARSEVKAKLKEEKVHKTFATHLVHLQEKLTEVYTALKSSNLEGLAGFKNLVGLKALLLMITPNRGESLRPTSEETWEKVSRILGIPLQTGSAKVAGALDEEV